jgi:hypothetical protein
MAVRGVPRPEAELARRVREAVGPKAFIAATFDLHGNEDEAFLKSADMAFRRGFDDNGFAKTILLVEPSEPFLGTTRLDKLPYRNVDLTQFYPYGSPAFSI